MLKQLGDYKNAAKYWRKARSKRKRDSYMYRKAEQEYKSSQWANLEKSNVRDNVSIRHLKNALNSKNAEFAAVLGPDSSLIYSALPQNSTAAGKLLDEEDKIQIFISPYNPDTKEWGEPILASAEIESLGYHIGNGSFNIDYSEFYFSACDSLCAIYVGQIADNKIVNATKLNNNINTIGTSNTQAHYTKESDKEYLYFISDRPSGEGGFDIWVSSRKDGQWQPAKNLGNKINTPDDELSPFYNSDQKRLYFSSAWHFGFGGLDIHYADKDEKGEFQLIKNMGMPINSAANDLYFNISNVNSGFLSSNRVGSNPWSKGSCCNDVFQFQIEESQNEEDSLPEIENISDLATYLPISLYFHNDEPNPKTTDTTTTQSYLDTWSSYQKLIPTYRREYSNSVPQALISKSDSVILHFFDSTATKGVHKLDLVSKLLLRELEKGIRIELAIKGYASPLAQSDYNKNLTLRRIQSLINHFSEYNQGEFKKYIADVAPSGGYLGFKKIPFGESKADTTVSDNVNDQRNSIYSRAAALERKIEILAISESNVESVIPEEQSKELNFVNQKDNLGKIKKGKLLSYNLEFLNDYDVPIKIDHVQPACGCTVADFPKSLIKPGEKGIIPVEIDTKELKKGAQSKSILIIANDGEIVQEVKFRFIVD